MFQLIPAKRIRPIVTEHHYLKRFPALPLFCFGAVEADVVTAACVFGFPPAKSYGPHALELQRLVRGPGYTGGQLTRFLSFCFRHIKKSGRRVDYIMSMADSGQGHHGGIYQAFGGVYLGTCPGQAMYLHKASGALVSRRNKCHDQKRHGAKTEEYVKQAKPAPKHLYVWPVQQPLEGVLALLKRSRLPYPKPTPK